MTNRGYACSLAVACLLLFAACSREPTPAKGEAADVDESTPPPATATTPPAPTYDRAKVASGMLTLIDTAPQCQTFRDRITAAGQTPAGTPLKEGMEAIVAQASAAGCTKKRSQ